ncbi:MAG: diaminopimelate epimerase [Holosporales bacterium]|jgi:diaminopimelate epimerase|nr:diaminopimelate epimerase [Holosporales bacterium]
MVHFYKMQALGNDFVALVDVIPSTEQICTLADRHYGIGADQVLCLSFTKEKPPSIIFFNADGSQAEMCGNGLRCAGLLLQRLTARSKHILHTVTRSHTVEILETQTVRVSMGAVTLLPSIAPETLFGKTLAQDNMRSFVLDYGLVDVGNPHLVFFLRVSDVLAMAMRFGALFETLEIFPKRTNVGFAHRPDTRISSITLAVWERGAGLTEACGSGATAAAALGHHLYALSWPICVRQKGGNLSIDMENGEYTQTGSAHFMFEGDISL